LEERAGLLRDAANRVVSQYDGDVRRLFARADCFIRRPDRTGIADQLAAFRAYEDPIGKKTFLLIKLLRRRRRLTVRDPEQIRVPIDHVVFTLALRSGLVTAGPDVMRRIRHGSRLRDRELQQLRERTMEAFCLVAEGAGQAPDEFDDLLWTYGRECLAAPAPFPEERIDSIRLPLDRRIGNREALPDFLRFITGIDGKAPDGAAALPIPAIPPTWYI
jgi:hypothetical protein